MTEQEPGLRAGTAGWPVASGRDGRRRADQRLPGLPGRPRLLAAQRCARTRSTCWRFARWLDGEGIGAGRGRTPMCCCGYLAACRAERRCRASRAGTCTRSGERPAAPGIAPATINRRLAAVSGLFRFRAMRDPAAPNPVPRGAAARRAAAGERAGLLAHLGRPRRAVEAAGPRAAAAAPRPGPGRDRRAAGQLPHRPGPGDRRADAAVRAALGRGARPGRGRRGHRRGAGSG